MKFIDDDSVGFQKKHDGERRTVFKSATTTIGGNRKGEAVPLPPEIVKELESFKSIDLDSEIIGNKIYVFDLMSLNGVDYKKKSFKDRMTALNKLTFTNHIIIVETAYTKADKLKMLQDLKNENAEGIVIKALSAPYTNSRPASGGVALKFKFYKTATVKVQAQTSGKRSIQVVVFAKGKAVEVGAVTIPPNHQVPEVGQLVEVRYLYAYKGGSLYQPTYLGVRTDLDDTDASINQLEYKAGV